MNALTPVATRVLVADDSAVDRTLLATIVGRAGFEVVEAVDGVDALEKFHAQRPDMVLLDALMPGKDGFAVAKEIKAIEDDDFVPIIFLTSLTEATDLARCVDAGGDDFLSKPYNRVILQAKLQAMQRMRDMHQMVQAQRDEISKHHMQLIADQEAAKSVFDNVAAARNLEAPYLQYVFSPLSLFNGDTLLAAQSPSKALYVLLGDFTGHGLAAAIGAMPLSDVFYGMTAKGFSLGEIMRECNRKLHAVLPSGYFCCATAICLDVQRGLVEHWNGGLPSAYLRRAADGEVVTLASQHLPLGILPDSAFKVSTLVHEVELGDRMFMATDGVIEARNLAGDLFGEARLEELVVNTPMSQMFSTINKSVNDFIGDWEGDDDLTMVEITVPPEDLVADLDIDKTIKELGGPAQWSFSYEVGASSLRDFNPVPLLQQVLMGAPYLRSKAASIYTVMAELFSNALEHGVLGLDSALKASADGFAEYYDQRASALEHAEGFVRFDINGSLEGRVVKLRIEVTDSGDGFDHVAYMDRARADAANGVDYHGRGVHLLWKLCQDVGFYDPGNRIGVTMSWELGNE